MLNNLGSVLREVDKLDQAEVILREALAIRRARFESPNPALAVSVNNLADLLLARNDLAGAEPLFRESLEMRMALYGEQHPAVGTGWINLAAVLQRSDGRQKEAVASYDEARRVLLATVGTKHPLIGAIDGNLGRLFHDGGEHERALAHLRAALAVRRESFDENHPTVLGNTSDIGRCLIDLGRYQEAETLLLEVYAGIEPVRDQQPRLWDSALIRLGLLYRAMGRDDEAAKYEGMRVPSASL
jgi:tetratricopeptide (TPR) repeat protein